jgi:capsular polysaccharide biosynthesis protein/Mrp family chromosome partitioning ATPase
MDLSGYLAVARRWWWTLIVAAWIAGISSYLVASTIPPTYESQVKVLVGPLNTDTDTLRASGFLVQTYAQYVTTREVLGSAIQELGLDISPDVLAASTRATANDITRILTIRVEADDPQGASDLANTIATELEQLTSRGLSRPEGLIQIIEFARPNPDPVAPQISLIVMLAALAGVVMAVIIVLLLEYFGNTVRTGSELAGLAKAPLLGTVQAPSGNPPGPEDLVVLTNPGSRTATPYRLLSAQLALGPDRTGVRSILVTDAEWEGQAGVVATNLAAALGGYGRRVVLVDGAGVGRTITRIHGWTEREGLSDLVSDPARAADLEVGVNALPILPAGRAPLDGADPERLRAIFDALAGQDGILVIAAAPIQAAPVTLSLARATDAVILVARRDRAHREDVALAGESLRLVGKDLAGVILTERGSILNLRRESATGRARATIPVAVVAASATGGTRAGSAGRSGRTRPSPAGATRAFADPGPGAPDGVGSV